MGHSKKRKRNEGKQPLPVDQIKSEDETDTQNEPQKNEQQTKQEINRRARIIVRNLSFKTTETKLKEFFDKFGPVVEVKLLKRPDGKLVGCGFIQYEVTQHAAKAIFESSGKPFLGRDIVCDWALGKDTYVRNMKEAMHSEIKPENSDVIEIKEESKIDDEDDKSIVKKVKTESDDEEKKFEVEKSESDDDDDDVQDEESEFDDDNSQISQEPEEVNRPKVISNDVQEGKTVFIKNVPFAATNNDVKQCMEQFGRLYYALVCMDRLTEHSKGTAFVKFQNEEDAEKCLAAGTELTLMGQILDCHKAVSKDDLDKKKPKKEVKKDTRNLYLIKEGVILAGSRAAQTVSASDMAKRLELERWKTQILRNLNMFISRNRLIIHNLPPTYDDKELKELFVRFSGATAVIKEAKVMKDLRNTDDNGKPISKEHGFVTFSDHEDALKALRAINNNPSIFTRTKRPIVAFSIENKSVINARNKRLLKSKLNNPTSIEFKTNTSNTNKTNKQSFKKQTSNPKFRSRDNTQTNKDYTGVTAKPGRIDKMRSRYKLTTQAQIHNETLKSQKKKTKLTRRVLRKKKEDYLKQNKQMKGKGRRKPKEDNFTKIIDKYKKNTSKGQKANKRKWFEQ